MRNDDIKILIDSLREEMRVGHTLTRATVKAEIDRLDEKVDRVIAHQEKQNGTLEKHDCEIKKLKPAYMMVQKKWFWAVAGIVFVLVYFILEALYNSTRLGEFIEKLI